MNTKKRDRIAGAIYGFAIGDAMGATTEFMSSDMIKAEYGKVTDIIGGGWLNLKPGEVTDDTEMTQCVIDALVNHKHNESFKNKVANNFLKWYSSNPKDVGRQCAKAINIYKRTGKFVMKDKNAIGNGSLMRAMPCAVLGLYGMNFEQGSITHNNDLCDKIIEDYTGIIQSYLSDGKCNLKSESIFDPSGFIVNTFNNSLYWSQKESFEEAIVGAVNHGGDADTIAAITGSIAGAKFGFKNIPSRWLEKIDSKVMDSLNDFKYFAFNYLRI